MTAEFERDVAKARVELDAARGVLIRTLEDLSDADLDRGPRGHWTVRRILEHVIWHEEIYVRMAAHITGAPNPGELPDNTPTTVADAIDKLSASRSALLTLVEGVDEETFYKLAKMGYEEYSVLSLLENEANHEREHAAQINKTLEG